jgi:hypothetical protein
LRNILKPLSQICFDNLRVLRNLLRLSLRKFLSVAQYGHPVRDGDDKPQLCSINRSVIPFSPLIQNDDDVLLRLHGFSPVAGIVVASEGAALPPGDCMERIALRSVGNVFDE